MGILSNIVNEDKVEMCSEACCGKPVTECKCGPDCSHCDCHSKNKAMNEAEKRWKQTSMSPEEAIEKYGKENVKVKKGALRNGDDMVEVFVESINEDGYDIAELVGDVHYHNNHYDRDERQNEMCEDAAKLVMAAKSTGDEDIIASAESVEHLCHHYDYDEAKDMLNNKLQELNQLVGGNELEVEESYSPGDEMEDGVVSNCCGAPLMDYNDGHGRCSDCKEMAAGETDEEYYESDEIQRLKDLSGIAESPTGAISGFAPQYQNPKDITNTDDALIHKGQTRGVNDPFDVSGTGHADGIGWSQDELDAADAGFQSALDTANQIKINRYLADLPNDIAKGIANKYGYGVATDIDSGKQFNPSWDGEYDHASNPNYGTDAMDPETIAKIKDPDWRNTYNMQDPKFKNIRPTEATNEEIEAEIKRLQDLIRY